MLFSLRLRFSFAFGEINSIRGFINIPSENKFLCVLSLLRGQKRLDHVRFGIKDVQKAENLVGVKDFDREILI